MKLAPLLLALFSCSLHAADKPNIIVIMADDMGYADAGFTGSKEIRTPHLDKLAASGVTFTSGYANHAFCGPSRAALMSGRYQARFGFETNPAYDTSNPYCGIDPAEILFPKRLQKAGYTTGVIGKWHLGAASPFHPNKRGFDYFFGFLGGGHDYFKIDLREPVKEGYTQALERNGKPAEFEGYLTTALSRDAVGFIESNKAKPFFLYLAYNAPHAPQQAPKEAIAKYTAIKDPKRRTYAAMVDVMDEGIGEVITALEKNGLRDNTLVFFLSDNGGPLAKKGQEGGWNGSTNTPFRGGKGNFYDGGIHVPFVASWPARIPKGTIFESPVIAIDISRTAVACAGGDATAKPAMEGVDLIPFVTGKNTAAPHEALFWRSETGDRWAALGSNHSKNVKDTPNGKPELYALGSDVSEANNIIAQQPEVAARLEALWTEWNKSNVPNRLEGYKKYHDLRDTFFFDTMAKDAKSKGYNPKPIHTFN